MLPVDICDSRIPEAELVENMRSVVFKDSQSLEGLKTEGYDFDKGLNYPDIIKSFDPTGFQAANLSEAIQIVNEMVEGIVTTASGIEQDIIKSIGGHTYIGGDTSLPGAVLRSKGLNRIGNLLVPDDNFTRFKDWVNPILDQMLEEQNTQHVLWTPSKIIARLGKEINDETSYLYWAYKNNIPVFCPGLLVGFLGDLLDSRSFHNPTLHVEMARDIKTMNNEVANANPRKVGMIILGGGLPKHYICKANRLRNGADYAIFLNTAQEFDGSDAGAGVEEAISWGQIGASAKSIKVHIDATIAFPFLVAETFAATIEKTIESKMVEEARLMENSRLMAFDKSQSLEGPRAKTHGYNFNFGINYSWILKSLIFTGFQATNLGVAFKIVKHMLDGRPSHEEENNTTFRDSVKCKIFLGFTSNLISSGVRDIIRYLVKHKMVDVIVTTTGGIEEDIIKCLASTYKGDFSLPGAALRSKGLNRIGNLLIPNGNYCKFEDWVIPVLDQMWEEQKTENALWTPSKVIHRLGKEINNESSYLYWAYKNNIPVFCPALTDGSLGDMLFFRSFRYPGLIVDVVKDIRAMNGEAMNAIPWKTGMIILGGGLPKHHICNANMMRNGADYAVFINTAQEFDGSDSGANPDEAVSWGKIRASAESVKVHCDATIAFPLLVAETFATRREEQLGRLAATSSHS